MECVGHIQVLFFDGVTGKTVILGNVSFTSWEEFFAAWKNVLYFHGDSFFMANHLDADYGVMDEKPISFAMCERLLGKPIAQLITEGRSNPAAELPA